MEYRKFNNVLSRETPYAKFKEVYDEVRGASAKKQIANYCFAKDVTEEGGYSGTSLLSLMSCGDIDENEKLFVFVGFDIIISGELTAEPSAVLVSINEEDETVEFAELPNEE